MSTEVDRLLAELFTRGPELWSDIRRSVAAQIARDLMTELDSGWAPNGRLVVERQLRTDEMRRLEAA